MQAEEEKSRLNMKKEVLKTKKWRKTAPVAEQKSCMIEEKRRTQDKPEVVNVPPEHIRKGVLKCVMQQ